MIRRLLINSPFTAHSAIVGSISAPVPTPVGDGAATPDRAVADPEAAFREIFDAHAQFVWRSLLGLGLSEGDVADASQQVFVVLHRKLDRLEPNCAMRTFVYGICLRVAADFRRRAHLRRERLCAEPPDAPEPAMQEDQMSRRQALRQLDVALERLDPAQRAAFVLYESEELPMKEVARALGCPLQTAYSRLHAARRCITAAMGEHLEDISYRSPGGSREDG